MARKGRTTAMIVRFRRDSVIPRWRYETIFACREALRKQTTATVRPIGTNEGQVMFVSVLNVIYREFIKRALSGMATQGGRL
jgi:hypothetical protein